MQPWRNREWVRVLTVLDLRSVAEEIMGLLTKAAFAAPFVLALPAVQAVSAQELLRGLDMTSPRMTEAEMSREEVVATLNSARGGKTADLSRKSLRACLTISPLSVPKLSC